MQAHHSASRVLFPLIAALVVSLTLAILPTFIAQGAVTIEALGCSEFNPGDKTISVSNAVAAGNAILVVVEEDVAEQHLSPTVTDEAGNTYTKLLTHIVPSGLAEHDSHYVFIATNVSALSAGQNISITDNGGDADNVTACAIEISDLVTNAAAVLDQSNSADSGGNATSIDSGSVTTTRAEEVIVGSFGKFSSDPDDQFTATGDLAGAEIVEGSGNTVMIAAKEVASTGTFSASVSLSAGAVSPDTLIAAILTLKISTAGITVIPTLGLTTTEAGGTATFNVSADTPPTATVTIPLNSSDTTEGTVPASVTLPASSTAAQTVTVTGVDDAVADGNIAYTIGTGDPTSTDNAYNDLGAGDVADVSATNNDNDVAGITVTPTSGLTTTEAGGTASFDVSADTPPTATVTVPLNSSDTTEGTVPASVTLPASSTAAQTVTVTGVDDAIVDGNIAYTIFTGDPTSGDGAYDALGAGDVADVSVTNNDDDVAGITVTPTSGLTTTEAGGTATFNVYANTPPTAAVTIPLSSSDTTEGTVPTPVTLPLNSTAPQTVTVTGVGDAIVDGNIAYTIVTGDPLSGDAAYNALGSGDVADVSATNNDNDVAGITVTPTSGLTTTEAGGTATFDVCTNTPPTADVTVPLSSSDDTEGTVPLSVTLPLNSTASQTVTVTGVDDAIVVGDIGYSIVTGDPTSGDGAYDALGAGDVADVSATNMNDDVPAPEINVERPSGNTINNSGTDAQGNKIAGSQVSLVYTVRNTGTALLNVANITATNANNVSVDTITPTNFTVTDGGGTDTFEVRYTPTAAGAFGFELHIANDDGDENPYDITVSGTATDKGDIDGDGDTDVLDARLCLQIATGVVPGTPDQRAAADVDDDGEVDETDARILSEFVIGIRTTLP